MGYHQADNYMHYKGLWRRKEKGAESVFKEVAINFPNLRKETDTIPKYHNTKQDASKETHTEIHYY